MVDAEEVFRDGAGSDAGEMGGCALVDSDEGRDFLEVPAAALDLEGLVEALDPLALCDPVVEGLALCVFGLEIWPG